jgi:hypothetical protein
MPTQNRRVATYLPSYIDEPFKAFKSQREISGDSEALIAILCEYLQVSQEVAYPSSSNLLQRIEAIEKKLGGLKGELLGELKDELQLSTQSKVNEKRSSFSGELQQELLITNESQTLKPSGNLLSKSEESSLAPMQGNSLARRFSLHKDSVAKAKQTYRDSPEKFSEWSRAKDPDSVTWRYQEEDKLYHPVQ